MNKHTFAKTNIEPRRTLSTDFTNQTMLRVTHLADQGRPRAAKGLFTMNFLHIKRTASLATLAVGIAVGGTAFAAMHWAGWTGTGNYTDVTTLANGNTRFKVTTQSGKGDQCADTNGEYYEIKAGAPVTPAQIADMVAGSCEYTDVTALFGGIHIGGTWPTGIPLDSSGYQAAKNSPQINDQYYMISGTVEGISVTDITLKLSNLNGDHTETLPLSPSVKIYDNGQSITLDSLHTGDPLQLLLTVKATYGQVDNLSLDWQNPNMTLPNSWVYGIMKVHHPLLDLSEQGKEYTRLVPAQGNPSKLVEEYPLQ